MKKLDIYLQNKRIEKAKRFIRNGDCVLDIGSHDGVMFDQLRGVIQKGIGVDPSLEKIIEREHYTLLPGNFPDACPVGMKYDLISMLAVLEHIQPAQQTQLARDAAAQLTVGGRVVITVPSPPVDFILVVLSALRLIEGIAMHEHYGFKPKDTLKLFCEPAFKLLHRERFQLGLNNLFVFEKR